MKEEGSGGGDEDDATFSCVSRCHAAAVMEAAHQWRLQKSRSVRASESCRYQQHRRKTVKAS